MPFVDQFGYQQRTAVEEISADIYAALLQYPAVLRSAHLTPGERRTLRSVETHLRKQLARVMAIENRLNEAAESKTEKKEGR